MWNITTVILCGNKVKRITKWNLTVQGRIILTDGGETLCIMHEKQYLIITFMDNVKLHFLLLHVIVWNFQSLKSSNGI